ncbi:hypothetical protein [Leifsonia sp. Le1]|uniref:hypothetical protein n=1 Tax=Leifsonia sp. Le1 TaxID=3404918 RepID=UPI003EB9CDCE
MTTSPEYAPPTGQPWQPAAPAQPQQPPYPSVAATPASGGYVLHRWPRWAQNTAVIVGAVAVLVVVFFAGFFTAHATDGGRPGIGNRQEFQPRQFGNGFGQNGGPSQNGGQSQNGGPSQNGG